MKPAYHFAVPLGLALGGILSAGCRTAAPFGPPQRSALAGGIIAGWAPASRLAAAAMIERYGPPDAVAEDGLGWKDKARWKKIVVRDRPAARFPDPRASGLLEQTVSYRMPEDKRLELAAFSGAIRMSPDGDTLTARADEEPLNVLALNLAVAIGRGDIGPARARSSYRRAVELSRAGKSSPLMRELLFTPGP